MEKLSHNRKFTADTISNNLNTLYHSDIRIRTKTGYKKINPVSQVIPIEVFEALHDRIIHDVQRKKIIT